LVVDVGPGERDGYAGRFEGGASDGPVDYRGGEDVAVGWGGVDVGLCRGKEGESLGEGCGKGLRGVCGEELGGHGCWCSLTLLKRKEVGS